MTGRRRRPGGSSPSPSTTRRRPDTGSDPGRSSTTGGRGVATDADAIDTMAGRLDATRAKVDGVAGTVGGINLGTQSMGVVGSAFTGAANTHLRTAQQHLTRTTQAVEAAQRGTRGTAQAYRTQDTTSASNLSAIDTTTRPPAVNPGSTTTAGTRTDPGGTASAPPTPPGGGGPPGGPGGGGPPPRRPGGGASGTPTSWRDDLRNHFTPGELRELDTAMRMMAADPRRGEVPGSGQLTQRERELLARAQGLVEIRPDTMMQKVLPPGALDRYLAGEVTNDPGNRFNADQVGGYVARQQDATHLRTPAELIQGNRLDYENTPFRDPNRPVHVMEFPAGNDTYTTPFGAPYAGGSGTHENWGVVQRAADDMISAAESQGLPSSSYRREVFKWPFSGVGLTADADLGIPERTTPYHQIPQGSTIYEYTPDGTKTPVAIYRGARKGWEPL